MKSYSYRLNQSFSPEDFAGDLRDNDKPMLVLVGSDDEAFYAEKFKPLFEQNAAQARVEVIPGVKHLALPGDGRTAEYVVSWLGGINSP